MFVIQTAALGAGLLLLGAAIDQFILKNQAALDVLKTTFAVLFDVPRIIIQETIPALMQIPGVLTSISVGLGVVTVAAVALGAAPALGFFIARLTLISQSVQAVQNAFQTLIVTGLVPMASQIGMAGDALTAMAAKATAAAAAQNALTASTAGATVATQAATVSNFRLSGTFLMTTKQAAALGPALTTLSVALLGVAGGTKTVQEAWKAFMGTVKLSLIPIASVVALIGVAMVGALLAASARFHYLQKEMADWNEQTNTMLDTSAKIERVMIRNAKEQEKRTRFGIALTQEEYTKNKQIRELAIKDIEALNKQIADLRASKDATGLNKAEIENQVQTLEDQIKRIQSRTENIQISSRPLQELGGTIAQLGEKSALALQGITNASGDPEAFKQAAEALTKITQQEFELGAISEKVATERLEALVNNTKLEVDLRVAAEQALQKIRESSTQKRIEEEKKAQQQIQQLADEGKMGEAKASQEMLNRRLKEIEIQLEAEKSAYKERMEMRKAELAYEWEKVNAQIESKERTQKYDKATDSTEAKADLDQQKAKLDQIKAQLDSGRQKIQEIQSKGGATSAEEQNQLEILKAEQKSLDNQQASYSELIKYLEATITRLDLKKESGTKLNEISASLSQTNLEIETAQIKLNATAGKNQKELIQGELNNLNERKNQLLAEQSKYQNASAEMSDEAKDNLIKELNGLKNQQKAIETSGNQVLEEEQRKHNNKLAELEAERAKVEKEKRDKEKQERLKDFDEKLKMSEADRVNGLKDEQQAAIDAQKINEGKIREEMKQLAERKKKLEEEAKKRGKSLKEFDKEAAEEIETQEKEHQQKLTEIRKQAFQRRMNDLKEDLQERLAVIEAAQETGKIDNQQAANQTLEATRKSAQQQLQLIKQQLGQLKETDKEGREELLKQQAEVEKQLAQAEKKALKDRTADIEQDTEERLSKIELAEKKGADRQATIQESLLEKQKGIAKQLELIQEAKKTARGEYLEELISQEQKLQGKLIDIEREAMEQRLADLKEDADEEQAILDEREAAGGDKTKLAGEGLKSREKSINQQLAVIRKAMLTASGEALEKLKAQEAKLLKEMHDARRQALDKQLADIKEDSEERLTKIERQEAEGADRQITIQLTRLEKEKEINDRLAVIRKELLTATGENYERLKASEEKSLKELNDIRRQAADQALADIKEDSEERMAQIDLAEARGASKGSIIARRFAEQQRQTSESLKIIREQMKGATGENLERLQAQEAKLLQEQINSQKQALEQSLANLKQKSDERVLIIEQSETEGADKLDVIRAVQVEKESEIAQRLKEIRKAMTTAQGENLQALKAQELKALKELDDIRKQAAEQSLAELKEDLDERLAVIELAEARGLDKQGIITRRIAEQERDIADRLKVIREGIMTASGEELDRLKAQEARLLKEGHDMRRQTMDQRLADIKEDSEEQATILESSFIAGKISEEQYYQNRLNTTLSFFDKQLAIIKTAQSKLTKDQVEEQERLAVQEAQLLKSRETALSEFQDAQIQMLERQQQKTIQEIEISEIERSKQLQQALNDGLIKQSDIDLAKLESTRERIKAELELEMQKLDFLKAQPPFNDPRKEEERQSKIRDSRKKTAQLQLQLLEQERQAQELLFKQISEEIDKQVAKIQNSVTAVQQKLELELKQQDYLSKALENQNRILQARQGLQSALGQFIETEFKIMEATANTEEEREKIARMQTDYKIKALQTEQQTQRQMLEIDIKRNEIAQQRAEMENKIAQIRATAEVAKAQAEFAKIKADPNAKPEQIEAARLAVDAANASLAGTIAEGQMLLQQRGIMGEENALKRRTLAVQQQTQFRNAELERVQGIKNPRLRELEMKEMSGKITPAEMNSLSILRERENYRKSIADDNQRYRDGLKNYGLNSQRAINTARDEQKSLPPKDADSIKLPEIEYLLKDIAIISKQGTDPIAKGVITGNNILSSIAGQLGSILGVIKNQPTPAPQRPITVNNITGGPTPQQVQQIANQTSLRNMKNVFRAVTYD